MLENSIHPDLLNTIKLLYNPLKFQYSKLQIENESIEYGACNFMLNEYNVKFRVAKTTPTKVGQFVTLWKRTNNGPFNHMICQII